MPKYQEQLEQEVEQYNQLHKQIQEGEAQIAQWKVINERRFGRIQLLEELNREDQDEPDVGGPEPGETPEPTEVGPDPEA